MKGHASKMGGGGGVTKREKIGCQKEKCLQGLGWGRGAGQKRAGGGDHPGETAVAEGWQRCRKWEQPRGAEAVPMVCPCLIFDVTFGYPHSPYLRPHMCQGAIIQHPPRVNESHRPTLDADMNRALGRRSRWCAHHHFSPSDTEARGNCRLTM